MKTIFKTIILSATVAAAVSCSGRPGKDTQMSAQSEIANVTVTSATVKDVPQIESYSSNVQAFVTNNVVPQAGNRIKTINVEIGDFVNKGQILAVMDQSNLDQTRLKIANDSTELERLKLLYAEGGISKADFEKSEMSYNISKSQYNNLIENTILRSPITGVVTARNYDAGDMYAMSSPIFTVQQISPVKLLVAISEADYSKIKKNDTVQITADALPGRNFEGKVNRIYPTIDPATHTFNVEVVVNNADKALRPGMYARATVTFAVNHSIVIPDTAIVKMQGSGQKSVFVLNSDNTVSLRMVTLGRHQGTEYEILEGLSEGEKVVVKGHTSLKNGSEVKVLN